MKSAFFVRHAKSSWKSLELSDHDRPLNKRGKRDAPRMAAEFLRTQKSIPLLISSTAKRTLETSYYFADTFNLKKKSIIQESQLYHGSGSDFSSVIFEQDNSIDSIMIFAHNPGLTYFANEYANFSIDNVPTTGIFKLESKADKWTAFFNDAKLTSFIYPKMFI